jgi:antagonist of KipI
MTNADAALAIVDPGLQSTIQDRGRRHVGQIGVSPSGFADWLSAHAANRIVGNEQGAPLIETTLTGCEFTTIRRLRIAVTGASATLTANGAERPMWQALLVPAGADVKLGVAQRGLRSYIAFYGGIEVPLLLGSASTDIVAGFGGSNGRALARGDALEVGARQDDVPEDDARVASWLWPTWRQPATLRVLPGPQIFQCR